MMDQPALKSLLLTLVIGFSGAGAATWAGLPAAPLVGSSIAVSIASLFKVTSDIPLRLRNLAFAVIGCSLGSAITKEALAQSGQWPFSLLILGITVCAMMVACSWTFSRFFSQSIETSLLATSPGALAYSLAIAAGGIGDFGAIVVIQNIRLLLVTSLLPFILDNFGFEMGQAQDLPTLGGTGSLLAIAVAFVVGMIVSKWKIPASFLLAGILISGIGHYLGLVIGSPPAGIIFTGFAITGSMVGARFSSIPLQDIRRLLMAALSTVLISGLLSFGFAILVAGMLDLPYGQVLVAYAPGGVEAMAAMALALGYDPAFVTIHHLFRIILLFLILPIGLAMARKLEPDKNSNHRSKAKNDVPQSTDHS